MGFGKDGKGAIITEQRSQALTTLAAQTAVLIGTKLAIEEDFRILKSHVHCLINGLTAGQGSRLVIGLADGNLTVAQIAEAITANGPLNPGDTQGEHAMRPVFIVGVAGGDTTQTALVVRDAHTNAPLIVQKNRWTFQDGDSWNWFVYNNSAAALTTGSSIFLIAKNFGVWVQ